MPWGEGSTDDVFVLVIPGVGYTAHGPFDFDTAQAQRVVHHGSHVVKLTPSNKTSTWTRKVNT